MAFIPRRKERVRQPIDNLAIDYDVPQELANTLVGRTEADTAHNIDLMIEYIEWLVGTVKERVG